MKNLWPSIRRSKKAVTFLLSILAVFCPLTAGVALAGVNTWTSGGPEGGSLRAMAFDPSTPTTIYVATFAGGVFKSTQQRCELESRSTAV